MIKPLLSAVANIFSAGSGSIFFIPNAKSLIRKYVKDKDRLDKIMAILADFEAYAQTFREAKQARMKEFRELNRTYNATEHELQLLLFKDMEAHEALQGRFIKSRVAVQRLIAPEEWAAIGQEAKKAGVKVYLDRQKKMLEFTATRDQIEAKATKAIREIERLREVRSILREFWKGMAEVTQAKNINVATHPVLSNRDSTEADLQAVANELNQVRRAAYDAFIRAHIKLRENVNESEWKKIV